MSYCNWGHTSAINQLYHDTEWGVPVHDDIKQFEFLTLEVMQCGLNWDLVINKREVFRLCFNGFDYDKIALYQDNEIERILKTPEMIKSRGKVLGIIQNAKCFQKIRAEYGSFSAYLWEFSGGKSILYDKHNQGLIPASNGLSEKISKELKKRGFKYLGPVVIYSHLQACGIINDHDENCPRYHFLVSTYPCVKKRRCLEKNVHAF